MAFNTPNMGLTIWDQVQDDFSHTDIENNFLAVDNHDHSAGKGIQITTPGIADLAVTQALLAAPSVGYAQLFPGSVHTDTVADQAITSAQLGTNSVTERIIDNGVVIAEKLDPTIVPLGTVVMWWRAAGSNATPGGFWEPMDGRPWNSITNAWNLTAGNIPDTRGIFVRGADILGSTAPAIGATGGSSTANLAHTHTVNAHVHGLTPHTHAIQEDGQHTHTIYFGRDFWSRQNTVNPNTPNVLDGNGNQSGLQFFSLYIKNITGGGPGSLMPGVLGQDSATPLDDNGQHNHTGTTAADGGGDTQGAGATTASALGSTSILPSYLSLLMIMRVR